MLFVATAAVLLMTSVADVRMEILLSHAENDLQNAVVFFEKIFLVFAKTAFCARLYIVEDKGHSQRKVLVIMRNVYITIAHHRQGGYG